jgi:N6-adenosine-specific RNA methylase IME4
MELIPKNEHGQYLPDRLEDLANFVLVGRDKLAMVRAGIRALDKLDVAEGVRKQKREEAQMLAEALLDAEVRIGEILAGMPKAKPGPEKISNSTVTYPKQTKEDAAKQLGFDKMQVSRFQTLAQNKDLVEQIKEEAREADDLPTRTAVLQAVKVREREKDIKRQKEEIETGKLPTLDGLFEVISVDPPWPYGREYDPEGSRAANPYPEMSIEQIKEIQLPTAENSVIFLWTTHAFLRDAFDILEGWGATYKATMVWNKQKIGMGAWFRMQCEFCLVGVIGKPYWQNTKYPELIEESRREHSRKPDAFFALVDNICAGRKLEYFSREARKGWEIFGNDIKKF